MQSNPKQLIDLSIMTIIKFFLVLLIIVFVYFFRDLFLIVFVAFVLASALRPGVDFLVKYKIPRPLSVLTFYLVFLIVVGFVITMIVPIVFTQLIELSNNLPSYYESASSWGSFIEDYSSRFGQNFNPEQAFAGLQGQLSTSASSIIDTVMGFFGGMVSFIVLLVITFYMLIEENAIKRFSRSFLPYKANLFLSDIVVKVQDKISSWLKGQIILSFLVSVLYFISLSILGIEYAFVIALFVFLGEFVPYIGPMLAAIPAILIAFIESPLKAAFVIIMIIVIQQAESHVLIPRVMQKAVGLNPIIIILAILIGAKLAGVVGVVLAIPVVTTLGVLIKEIYLEKERDSVTAN